MTIEELMELKSKAEAARERHAELVGRRKQLTAELKDRFGCTTPAAAEKKLKTLRKELSKLTSDLEEKAAKLDEEMRVTEEDA